MTRGDVDLGAVLDALGWRAAGPIAPVTGGQDRPVLIPTWAGVILARGLEPRIGRANRSVRREDVERIWQWVARWKERAGIVDGEPHPRPAAT